IRFESVASFAVAAGFAPWPLEETTGDGTTPRMTAGGRAAEGCRRCGCVAPEFLGRTIVCPMALRRVCGVVLEDRARTGLADRTIVPAVPRLGLREAVFGGVFFDGSTGGGTTASGSKPLFDCARAGFAALLCAPRAAALPVARAVVARAPCCAWASLAKQGWFAASVSSAKIKSEIRKRMFSSQRPQRPDCGGSGTPAEAVGVVASRSPKNN